jgi:hypothetical protein
MMHSDEYCGYINWRWQETDRQTDRQRDEETGGDTAVIRGPSHFFVVQRSDERFVRTCRHVSHQQSLPRMDPSRREVTLTFQL